FKNIHGLNSRDWLPNLEATLTRQPGENGSSTLLRGCRTWLKLAPHRKASAKDKECFKTIANILSWKTFKSRAGSSLPRLVSCWLKKRNSSEKRSGTPIWLALA